MLEVKTAVAADLLQKAAEGTPHLLSGREAAEAMLSAYAATTAENCELKAQNKRLKDVNADLLKRLERANLTIDALLSQAGDMIEKRG